MKVFLLGATGRTGKLVLESALEMGYEVHCLVRNSDKINGGTKVFEGNPSNVADLERAMAGCSSIINVLNISRNTDFPWSKLRTPDKFLSNVMANLIPLAEKHEIERVISCSAWGVLETRKDLPFWFRWTIDYSNIGIAYADHERQEELLQNSGLNWTIVRPVGLTSFNRIEKVKVSFDNSPKPGLIISRKTVAKYMVDCMGNEDLIHKKVVVSKG